MNARLRPVVKTPGGYVWQAEATGVGEETLHYSTTPTLRWFEIDDADHQIGLERSSLSAQ